MGHLGQWNVSALAPPRKSTPSEETDEAPGQIEKDQVDVERGIPTEHSESIEQVERNDQSGPPLFEE